MPLELKQQPNWVLWAPIWNGSKYTKRPIQPSGYAASTTNPKHWSSFEAVKQAYERALKCGYIELREKNKPVQHVPIGGVGYVFDGQPDANALVFTGVDFDRVISNGAATSLAKERIRRLNSYAEMSVSGSGLHVIVKALPLQSGVAQDGVEIYNSGRFFTMTGRRVVGPQTIVSAPEAVALLAEELRSQKKGSRAEQDDPSSGRRKDEVSAETHWFQKLPPDKQSEVIKYAAIHIAKNSKLFELTEHGGNYTEYFDLTLAIARSGVADAEDIFVEAASIAKDADPKEKLRDFFRSCRAGRKPIRWRHSRYVVPYCDQERRQFRRVEADRRRM